MTAFLAHNNNWTLDSSYDDVAGTGTLQGYSDFSLDIVTTGEIANVTWCPNCVRSR